MSPRPRGTWSALLAALVVLLAVVAPAGVAAARTATPTPAPSTPTDRLPVRVQLTEVTPSVLRPGQDLLVRARLTNTTTAEVAAPRVLVHLERIRPGSRADLRGWLDEPADGNRVGKRLASVDVGAPLAPGASVDVDLQVAAATVGLLDRPDTWGARGLAVQVTDAGERVGLQRSFVLWATESEDVPQARVSVLAPVVGPPPVPEALADGVAAPGPALTELVQPDGRLGAALQIARTNPDVALAVDPAVTTAARAGTGQVRAWADGLAAAAVGRDVLALPWADPDLGALAHGDGGELLTAAVAASTAAGADALEEGRPLSARGDVLWASGPADRATVALAARAGASVLVLAPGDAPSDDDAAGARTSLPSDGGTLVGLVPDATLSTLFTAPQRLDPDATTTTAVQRVLAELSVIAHSSPDGLSHVLVALPRDAEPDPAHVEALLQAVQSAPWSRTAPLTALLGSTRNRDDGRDALPAVVTTPDALAPDQVRRLTDARRATVAFASVTDDPATLLDGVDAAVLAPVATAWRDDTVGRALLVEAAVAHVDARRTGLALGRTSTQNLISADSEVRFSVRNDLRVPASVRVQTTPRKACLRTEPSATVVVPAGGEEVVPVPVHAIANCEVVVEAVLASADGTAVATPVTFVVRASPTIESVGTAIVGALLAVGLVLGVVRTVRRGQSARRGARRVAGDAGTRPLPVLGGAPEADT